MFTKLLVGQAKEMLVPYDETHSQRNACRRLIEQFLD